MPFLRDAISSDPHGIAVDDGHGVWTYGDLDREAGRVAGGLLASGLEAGDVVAPDWSLDRLFLACIHGVWRAGGVAAPLNERWTDREKDEALRELAPRLVLDRASAEGFRRGGKEVASIPIFREGWEDRTAVRLLTSGTTGSPKTVQLSFRNLRASAMASKERLGLSEGDRWLASLSPAHVGGVALITRASLLRSVLVIRGPFDAGLFVDLLRSDAVGFASLVPTMLHQILESWGDAEVPASLKCLLIGGAPAPNEVIRDALDKGFPLALTYGLTEASSQVATAPPLLVQEKPGTVGPPLPGVDVRIMDSGELAVRGSTVATGQVAPDGWLHTGDLARMDADGHLWITGRLSDRIITGGVNVEPLEVEGVLEALPWVKEAAVVGVPDKKWGEKVVAAIVPAESGVAIAWEELDLHARAELSSAKRPREFREVPELPRNRNGKVDRAVVRALFL